MAAENYEIVCGWLNAYLARKKKPSKRAQHTMSNDRRVITEDEILHLFEFYLRQWCMDHNDDTVVVTNDDGKIIFKAKLLDIDEKDESKARNEARCEV